MSDALHDAIRIMATYANRAGYAEAAVETLCEQIERLPQREDVAALKATAARVLEAMADD